MSVLSFINAEPITVNDVVYVDSVGFLRKASANTIEQASAVGLALDTGDTGSLIRVNSDGFTTELSGMTSNTIQYVSVTSGQLADYPTWRSELLSGGSDGAFLTSVGKSVSSSGLSVEISRPIFVSASGL